MDGCPDRQKSKDLGQIRLQKMSITKNQIKALHYIQDSSTMQKLYSIAFQRILNRLGKESIEPYSIKDILTTQNIREVGNFIYHRLPRQQFRSFIKTPCPIAGENTNDPKAQVVIDASKRLRSNFSVEEKKVCSRCPFQKNCSHFGEIVSPDTADALPDVLIFMESMKNKSLVDGTQIEYKVWKSGYKSCDSILSVIEDLSKGGQQTYQFQKLRLQHVEQKKSEQLENNSFSTQILKQRAINIEELTPTKTQERREKNRLQQEKKTNNRVNEKKLKQREIEQEEDSQDEQKSNPLYSKKYADLFSEQERYLNQRNKGRQEQPRSRQRINKKQNDYSNNRRQDFRGRQNNRYERNQGRQDRRRSYDNNRRSSVEPARNQQFRDYKRQRYGTKDQSSQKFEDYKPHNGKRSFNQNEYRSNQEEYRGNRNRSEDRYNNREEKRNNRTGYGRNRQDFEAVKQQRQHNEFMERKFAKAGNQYKPSRQGGRPTNKKVYQQWDQTQKPEDKFVKSESQKVVIKEVEYVDERADRQEGQAIRRGRRVNK